MYIIWTAGFFYKDWIWKFYPKNLSWSKWLEYYAQYFNGLEVNSSFYRLPSKSTINGFNKIDLSYIFKMYRLFTHFKKYDDKLLIKFLEILSPLKDSWKLKWFLFQFSAKANKDQVFDCLNFVRQKEKDLYFFVELRNLDLIYEFQKQEIIEKLKNLKTSLVYVDGIFRKNEIIYDWQDLGFKKCYFRFHWRWQKLYDYLYSEKELREFAEKIKEICVLKEECYLFFNNTVKAQAIENALYIKDLLLWEN